MTFDEALDDVAVEDACKALGLDEDDTNYVLEAHRRAPTGRRLLGTILAHGGDHKTYVESKLAIRRELAI